MVTRARRIVLPSKALVATTPAQAQTPRARHAKVAIDALEFTADSIDEPWVGVLTVRNPYITGAKGANRNQRCKRRWLNDYEALRAYFKESVRDKENTIRRYVAELGKVFLWAALEKKRAVSSLDAEDLQEFMGFLMFPPKSWVGPRSHSIRKGGQGWKPLAKPASNNSVAGVLNVLQGFYSFLLVNKYIKENPLDSFRRIKVVIEGERKEGRSRRHLASIATRSADTSGPKEGVKRALDRVHLVVLFAGLTSPAGPKPIVPGPESKVQEQREYEKDLRAWQLLADRDRNERAWFLLHALLYSTPRVSELANAKMNDLVLEGGLWWWNIHGKGDKDRRGPVVPELFAALMRYRKYFGYPGDPSPHEDTPLLFSLKNTARPAITPRNINLILDDIGRAAAAALDQVPGLSPDYCKKLKGPILAQSAHWWRHAGATRQAVTGVPDWALQHNLGHNSIEIARRYYLEDQERERHQATSNVRLLPEYKQLGIRDPRELIAELTVHK